MQLETVNTASEAPLLTVCIATYNRWFTCMRAIRSVVNQQGVRVEAVVVDDASSEQPDHQVARLMRDEGVRYIRHQKNLGLAAARNTALREARGAYFSFCDDDDIWPEDMAKGLLGALWSTGLTKSMGLALGQIKDAEYDETLGQCPTLQKLMLRGVTPPVSAQIYPTELLRQIDGYDERIKSGVDHDLWISLAPLNPRVGITWDQQPVVGSNPEAVRMTTNEYDRRQGISESLNIWRPKLVKVFGTEFYSHFRYCYFAYLDYKFLQYDIKRGKYLSAMRRIGNVNVLRMMARRLSEKVSGRYNGNQFVSFNRARLYRGGSMPSE